LQFQAFDLEYVENLRAGDPGTQEHFVGYFSELIHLKLRPRLNSPQAIEDVSQETFARVLATLRTEGALRQPERLGAYVNTVCNNVLLEHYRSSARSQPFEDDEPLQIPAVGRDALDQVAARQISGKVREILMDMPDRDRSLLNAVFLEEEDRDEVCRKFGVDREYLRVLLHRAKAGFKSEFLKRLGERAYATKD